MTTIGAGPNERLENGRHPDTPAGDNLLLDYVRGEAAAFAATIGTARGRLAHDRALGLQLCDLGVASPFGNVALLEQPTEAPSVAALADALRSFFGATPGGPYLVFSAWPLDLAAQGFVPVGHPPLMLRPAGGSAPAVAGIDIREVVDADGLADFEQTLIEAYPAPEMQPWQRGAMFDPAVLDTAWRLFVGYEDGRPVATAGAFVTPTVTVVELVSTRAECRGRGYGTAITAAATLVDAAKPAMLIASDLGRGSYERLGYVALLRYSLWLGLR